MLIGDNKIKNPKFFLSQAEKACRYFYNYGWKVSGQKEFPTPIYRPLVPSRLSAAMP
jgi:hypothetical protein